MGPVPAPGSSTNVTRLRHGGESEASSSPAEVRPGDTASTCTSEVRLSDIQRECRELAKNLAHDVSADTCGKPALGRALGKSDTYGRKLCDPTDTVPLALGDILAIGRTQPDFARELLERCLKEVNDHDPAPSISFESAQRRISAQAGLVAQVLDKALRDEVISRDERLELLSTLKPLRRRVDEAIDIVEAK